MQIIDFVKKYDPQNQFDVLVNSYQQIDDAWGRDLSGLSLNSSSIKNIIISGLGGSAISADLIKNFLVKEINTPIIVNRNYNLPSFANQETMFIASSYSGNTEETISSLMEAIEKKCRVICVSTGGKVEAIAKEKGLNHIKLKSGFQPRYALGTSFFTLLKTFQHLNFIDDQNSFVNKIRNLWEEKGKNFTSEDNIAFQIAVQLVGFIPIVYSVSDVTNSVGYRLKSQINENSKLHSFHHEIPEMNHNEIIGWESYQEKDFRAKVIQIFDESYHPQIKKRFTILNELLSKSGLEIIKLESSHEDFKVRLLDLIYLSDWISYYLGVLRGFDPSEIDYINFLKEKL